MRVLVLSNPHEYEGETKLVNRMFEEGLERFHLRKPGWEKSRMAKWIEQIGPEYHDRIAVHSYFELIEKWGLGGMHFTEAARKDAALYSRVESYQKAKIRVSGSFHKTKDVIESGLKFDYLFLSPIFDSLSKQGLKAGFEADEIKHCLAESGARAFALGGCRPEVLGEVQEMGFSGAAFLGAVWNQPAPLKALKTILAQVKTQTVGEPSIK